MRIVVPSDELHDGIARLGGELGRAYPDGVVLVAVLKGSVLFLADLARQLTVPVEIDFLAVSSYAEGSGRVRIVKDLDMDITDRDVVLVEDVIDTGLTLSYLLGELERRQPRSLEVCALIDKTLRRVVPVAVRWRGFTVDDDFLIGYGLDHAQRYRNLDVVAAADRAGLVADPDAHVGALYGPGAAAGAGVGDQGRR